MPPTDLVLRHSPLPIHLNKGGGGAKGVKQRKESSCRSLKVTEVAAWVSTAKG